MWRINQEIPLSWINLLLSSTITNEIRSQLISALYYVVKFAVSLSLYQVIVIVTNVQFGVGGWGSVLPGNSIDMEKFNYAADWNCSWKYRLRKGAILDVLYNKHSPKYKHHIIISAVVQMFRLVLEIFLSV